MFLFALQNLHKVMMIASLVLKFLPGLKIKEALHSGK